MNEINIGILGLGWVAGAHIEAFKSIPDARVVAVCSRRPLDENELKRQFGIPLKVYPSLEAMIADSSIQVIDICTPHPFHADQAITAARGGKHLIIEKPMCLSFAEALAMREAIRKAGIKVCVCLELRFGKHFNLVRSCLEQGLLGELYYAEVDYFHGIGPWYKQYAWNIKKDFGGSSLLTAGCHALDGLLYFMGSEVEEVTSYGCKSQNECFAPYEYETTSVTLLKFKGGQVGKVSSVIDCLQPYYFHIHLLGSLGSLLDNRIFSQKLNGLSKERWSTLETSLVDSGDVKEHPYQPQFETFLQSLKENVEMPLTNFETAFETHRVIFAADQSAREGRPVKLSEFRG